MTMLKYRTNNKPTKSFGWNIKPIFIPEKPITLEDRINRVINTDAFEKSLNEDGLVLFDFQLDWAQYSTFDNLPPAFKKAILAGETELSKPIGTL